MQEDNLLKSTSDKAHAYTPGLKVKRSTKVSKYRRLPIPGKVLVKLGESVEYDSVVAVTKISGEPQIVKVSAIIGVEPEDLPNFMLIKEGDSVKKGEPIAHFSALFGLIKKTAFSPIDGILESMSSLTGQCIIRGDPIPLEIESYIPGKIIEIIENEGVIIETNAALIQGILGVGGESHGKLRIAVESPADELSPDHIQISDTGNILVGGSIVSLEALKKSVEIGVSSIITGGIRHDVLKDFMKEDLGVAITGQEELGITLIITEGFGKMNMSQKTFNLLKYFENYDASVNGATQIRAGVLRPEIIIPHTLEELLAEGDLSKGLTKGTLVRVIRQPYFGAIAKVNSLPIELEKIQTESLVRVVNVELENDRIVTVPRANVEIIEE